LRYYEKLKPKVYEARSEEDLDKLLMKHYPGVHFGTTFSEKRQTVDGFKMSNIRKLGVWSKDYVIRTNYGIYDNGVNGRKFVCYEDVNDRNTEVYVALVNDGSKYNGEIKTDSLSSMYSK
jgi:hypothetical protein